MNTSNELDAMAEMNEMEDLGNLFEFGDIDLSTMVDPALYGDHLQQQQHSTHPGTPFRDMNDTPPMFLGRAQTYRQIPWLGAVSMLRTAACRQ